MQELVTRSGEFFAYTNSAAIPLHHNSRPDLMSLPIVDRDHRIGLLNSFSKSVQDPMARMFSNR